MRFKLGRFGATKTPADACGCSPTPIDRARLLKRLALKARAALTRAEPDPPATEPEVEERPADEVSVFDRICGVPIWLLEAEGWTPGEDPAEYFDVPLDGARVGNHDLTTTWYERLELEYARMDAEEGDLTCPSD